MADPAYLDLHRDGRLAERAAEASAHLRRCDLCARDCRVDRTRTVRGAACRTGVDCVVSSFGPHHGEERPLSGVRGSGTIFFAWCNLRCLACQNWEISWIGTGRAVTTAELATMMLSLQRQGCHNINLVSPSHVVAQVVAAVAMAAGHGLRLPLVYNTGGYDSPEALRLLDGIVDIYMPDMKFGDDGVARRYAKVRGYPAVNRAAVREMHRQVGDLVLNADGVAVRGLLVRHLVLPGGLAGTREVLAFLADEISPRTYVNIMTQYRPCHRAGEIRELGQRPSPAEFQEAFDIARSLGLMRLDGRAS